MILVDYNYGCWKPLQPFLKTENFINEELWKDQRLKKKRLGSETYIEWSHEVQSYLAAQRIFTPLVETNENAAADPPPRVLFHNSISK